VIGDGHGGISLLLIERGTPEIMKKLVARQIRL